MPLAYYSSDSDSDHYSRGRRRPSAQRHRSDRRSAYLGADLGGNGLHRTRSQGHSPAPVVNVFNDVAADAYQRTENSRSPPYAPRVPYPPSPDYSQRGRRDRLGGELIDEIQDLTLENRRLRSRSRGRSDAGYGGSSAERYEWELRQREKELKEIERQKQFDKEKKQLEQDIYFKKIEDDKERKRIIADYERKQREDEEGRKAEEKRILEKHEREQKAKAEKEKKEWEEFERRQKEKKQKEEEAKKKKEEEFEEEMRRRLARQGYSQAQIDVMVKEKDDKKQAPQTTTTTTTIEKFRSSAPVYAKIHRDYLSIDTLRYYEIPYEYDRNDSNYIIILREMDKYETEVLFEHTRRLRAGKLLLDAPGKDKKNYAFYRKRDRSSSRVKKVGILEFKT